MHQIEWIRMKGSDKKTTFPVGPTICLILNGRKMASEHPVSCQASPFQFPHFPPCQQSSVDAIDFCISVPQNRISSRQNITDLHSSPDSPAKMMTSPQWLIWARYSGLQHFIRLLHWFMILNYHYYEETSAFVQGFHPELLTTELLQYMFTGYMIL